MSALLNLNSLCANPQDHDMYSYRVLDRKEGNVPTTIRQGCQHRQFGK